MHNHVSLLTHVHFSPFLVFSPIDLYGQYVTHLALLASSINGGDVPFPSSLACVFSLNQCVVLVRETALQCSLLFAFVTAEGGDLRRGGAPLVITTF